MAYLELPQEFGWVLFECVLICFQCIGAGYSITGFRKTWFGKEFYEKNFPELLKDKNPCPEWGYPDMGEGQFCKKLPLQDWMKFQSYQRVHYNYLEGLATILAFLLVSGLFFPRYTAAVGAIYIVGRFFYSWGYKQWGSRGRVPGAVLVDLALVAALAGALYGAFTLTQSTGVNHSEQAVSELAAAVKETTQAHTIPPVTSTATAAAAAAATTTVPTPASTSPFLQFKANDINRKPVDFSQYADKVVLVVNVASYCGYTPQYSGLEQIYREFKDQGLVVLGFPCNQFGSQEPDTLEEIKQFCSSKYGVTFPLFSKIDVNGPKASPIYQYLKKAGNQNQDIAWNFEKFLVDRSGAVMHFPSATKPEDLRKTIQRKLSA